MNKILPRLLIVAIVMLQLMWLVKPHVGSHPVSPRVLRAIKSHESSPKSERDAAIAEAFNQDSIVEVRRIVAILAFIVTADILLVFYFWNYGIRKTPA